MNIVTKNPTVTKYSMFSGSELRKSSDEQVFGYLVAPIWHHTTQALFQALENPGESCSIVDSDSILRLRSSLRIDHKTLPFRGFMSETCF